MREVEKALADKETRLKDALAAAESANACRDATTVEKLEIEITTARETVEEKSAEVTRLQREAAEVEQRPQREPEPEYQDAFAALAFAQKELEAAKTREKDLERAFATAELEIFEALSQVNQPRTARRRRRWR